MEGEREEELELWRRNKNKDCKSESSMNWRGSDRVEGRRSERKRGENKCEQEATHV